MAQRIDLMDADAAEFERLAHRLAAATDTDASDEILVTEVIPLIARWMNGQPGERAAARRVILAFMNQAVANGAISQEEFVSVRTRLLGV